MKKDLREIYWAPNRAATEAAVDAFAEKYRAKYGRAVECLAKDRDSLLAFYDFPAEHWDNLRTTNPIEASDGTRRHFQRPRAVHARQGGSSVMNELHLYRQFGSLCSMHR